MSKVLYLTANPKTVERSVSLGVGEAFLKAYQAANPENEITIIDLYNTDIPELDFGLLYVIENLKKGILLDELNEETQNNLQCYNNFTDQFVQADKYIFVTPMWNLGLPSRVKDYIDTICVPGKTFKYIPKGPQGLLKNKKCLHIHASGGFYSNKLMNYADTFLRDIMKFIGVEQYRSFIIEGHGALSMFYKFRNVPLQSIFLTRSRYSPS